MGYEFDNNGKYIGWSNLFDYSSIRTIRASEYLPIPNNITYEKGNEEGLIDISDNISEIITLKNLENSNDTKIADKAKADKIFAIVKLLNKLESSKIVYKNRNRKSYVTWNETIPDEFGNIVLGLVNKHESTILSPNMILRCLRNSISSSISNIIQNPRNLDLAYSPITMKSLRRGAESSPKGSKASRMTLMNPATKFIMLEQNMVGKNVIGISAVGEKVFFNLSYYWNEGIRSNNEEWIKNLQFYKSFDRILGRFSGNITPTIKTKLADVNFEGAEEFRLRFENISKLDSEIRLKYGISSYERPIDNPNYKLYYKDLVDVIKSKPDEVTYADDLISLLLSAATDSRMLNIF